MSDLTELANWCRCGYAVRRWVRAMFDAISGDGGPHVARVFLLRRCLRGATNSPAPGPCRVARRDLPAARYLGMAASTVDVADADSTGE